jgi:hypothetical protein
MYVYLSGCRIPFPGPSPCLLCDWSAARAYPSIFLPVHRSACLSTHLPACPHICLPVHTNLPVHAPAFLSYICFPVYTSAYLFFKHLTACPHIYLPVYTTDSCPHNCLPVLTTACLSSQLSACSNIYLLVHTSVILSHICLATCLFIIITSSYRTFSYKRSSYQPALPNVLLENGQDTKRPFMFLYNYLYVFLFDFSFLLYFYLSFTVTKQSV